MSVSKKKFDGPAPEEKIVAGLVELMEAGIAPWRKPWAEDGCSGHHVNLLSGHQYRGSNVILLTIGQMVVKPALHGIATQNSFRVLLLGSCQVAA